MKLLPFVLVIIAVVGCQSQSAPVTSSNPQQPLTSKLQSMTPEQRTEYAKTHMDEFKASMPPLSRKKL